jgi:hypothetical protein
MRKPIAVVFDPSLSALVAVCDDGAVFSLESSADEASDESPSGLYWVEVPPIPGTKADES